MPSTIRGARLMFSTIKTIASLAWGMIVSPDVRKEAVAEFLSGYREERARQMCKSIAGIESGFLRAFGKPLSCQRRSLHFGNHRCEYNGGFIEWPQRKN